MNLAIAGRAFITNSWAILPGALAAAGQAPLHLWWGALFGWALAIASMMRAKNLRHAALIGWMIGLGYIGATHFWIVEPFFVDAARHGWMAPFALAAMVAGLSLFFLAGFAGAYWLGWSRPSRILALPLCLSLADLLRGWLFTGFPWAQFGSLWIEAPQIQLISLIGVPGLGFVTFLALAAPLAASGSWRLGAGAAAVLAFVGAGLWGGAMLDDEAAFTQTRIRVVQPNAPQDEKWRAEMIPVFFERLIDLTAAEPTNPEAPPDLIIWPETALATRIDIADQVLDIMSAAAGEAELIFGGQRLEDRSFFNSLAVMNSAGAITQIYDKHHLVPFGEYVPFVGLLGRLGIGSFSDQIGGYTAGPGPRILDLGTAGRILPLICYEAIFARDVLAMPERPDWILHITNDAWFGATVMPAQHLDQSRLRAIEQGLPAVRAANTGISAVIDPNGRILTQLSLNETGFFDANLPARHAPTLYSRTGNWPIILVLLVLTLGMTGLRRQNRH